MTPNPVTLCLKTRLVIKLFFYDVKPALDFRYTVTPSQWINTTTVWTTCNTPFLLSVHAVVLNVFYFYLLSWAWETQFLLCGLNKNKVHFDFGPCGLYKGKCVLFNSDVVFIICCESYTWLLLWKSSVMSRTSERLRVVTALVEVFVRSMEFLQRERWNTALRLTRSASNTMTLSIATSVFVFYR